MKIKVKRVKRFDGLQWLAETESGASFYAVVDMGNILLLGFGEHMIDAVNDAYSGVRKMFKVDESFNYKTLKTLTKDIVEWPEVEG